MGFVVQVVSRAGRVLHNHRFDRPTASIGRGYDNDVYLDDPFVDAQHLRIDNSLNGLQLTVLSDAGRTELEGERISPGAIPLSSGADLLVGKTHLRILASNHPVPPVRLLQRSDAWLASWSSPAVVLTITILFMLGSGLDAYFSTLQEWELSGWVFDAMTPLLGAAMYVAVAALVTRVVRHDSQVRQHWLVVILFLFAVMVWHYLEEIMRFNLGDHWLSAFMQTAVIGLLLVALFWSQMRIAFRQKAWIRLLMANVLGWGIIGYSFLGVETFTSENEPAPEFEALILPEAMRLRGTVSEEAFMQGSDQLFEFSAEELE